MIAAVVPTCRGFKVPEQTLDVHWYVVHDIERWPVGGDAKRVTHIVAPEPGFYGQRCDSIRAAGFAAAYRDGASCILTVDDDCFIPPNWAEQHMNALNRVVDTWDHTLPGFETRGMPDSAVQAVAISHGLWDGVPDLSGLVQRHEEILYGGTVYQRVQGEWGKIHAPFAQSAMNLGFVREVAPVMYQPAQGEDTPFDRFADIWGGVLAQRVLSLHDYGFLNGGAVVYHTRKSCTEANIEKEAPGVQCHETFWAWVWAFRYAQESLAATYAALAAHVEAFPTREEWKPYFTQLGKHMRQWLQLLEEADAKSYAA